MRIVLGFGTTHARGYLQNGEREVQVGDVVRLEREPSNPYDCNAVAVLRCGQIIGRINAGEAKAFSQLLLSLGEEGSPKISFNAKINGIDDEARHTRKSGARYQYTQLDIELEFSAEEEDRYPHSFLLHWMMAKKGIDFRSSTIPSDRHHYVDGNKTEAVSSAVRRRMDAREERSASSTAARPASSVLLARPMRRAGRKKAKFTLAK